jgi:formylglycine-generating enzyme
MKRILILTIVCLIGSVVSAQDQDCYDNLLSKGITEYNAGNCELAKKKWKGALDCSDLTSKQRQTLNDWIAKCNTTPSVFDLPEMVFVQGGAFKMGSNDGESADKPIHTVTLDNFSIGKYEITVAQFAVFIKETAYLTTAESAGFSVKLDFGNFFNIPNVYWKHDVNGSLRPKSEYNHPVIHVSWHDAIAYCAWLSRKTGKKYRLLTEAEWEYAAKGGNKSNDYKYSGNDIINEVAWNSGNANKVTHSVGTKQANELGVFDMTGNVYEWCNDWFGMYYYQNSPSLNPQGVSSEKYRVMRGSSWISNDYYSNIFIRSASFPDMRNSNLGFRVAHDN